MASQFNKPTSCQWTTQSEAFRHFATYEGRTQSQRHIKPLHWYVACRLVLEGGFRPSEIQPRPRSIFMQDARTTFSSLGSQRGAAKRPFWEG